jgi:hypothetical protein
MTDQNDHGREPRKASDVNHFPYGYPGMICYIELVDGALRQASTRGEIRAAVLRAMAGASVLYATWPGQYRTDLFVLDELPKLAEAVALPQSSTGH